MDVLSLALSKKFTEETVAGGGAIKGKNCTIQSIEAVEGGNNVTFQWTLDDGTVKTQTMFVANGAVGPEGPKGADGTMTFADLTEEQKASLKGDNGVDGITPHIGDNGNWFIGETDTGVNAEGNGGSGSGTVSISTKAGNAIVEEHDGLYVPALGGDTNPVGLIIEYTGTTPDHYLPCDGSIYNIADYPDLAEYFRVAYGRCNEFGGDGITTFAVPDMFEPEEPTLIHSSFEGYPPANATDGDLSTFWHTNEPNGAYVGYSYPVITEISGYSITNRKYSGDDINYSPNTVSLQVSDDGDDWTTIETQQLTWTASNETKSFTLDTPVETKNCRLSFTCTGIRLSLAEFTLDSRSPYTIFTHFIKAESTNRLSPEQQRADIDYIALMTGVDLEV